jgi:hypothetical protein
MTDPGGLPTTLAGFEAAYRQALEAGPLAYYSGAAADELTLGENRAAWDRIKLSPRVMIDVSERDPSVEILGRRHSLPLAIAPTAYHRIAHPGGEEETATGAAAADVTYTLSTLATSRPAPVAEAAPDSDRWFQVYVFRDRAVTMDLVAEAEENGFEALMLTVDLPVLGKRDREIEDEFVVGDAGTVPGIQAAGGQGLTSGTIADDLGRQASNLQMNEAFPGAAGSLFRNLRKPLASWQTWNPFATRGRSNNPNFLLDLSDRAASFTDAGNRLGTFLNRTRKGDSPEAAKAVTDLTQVLYGPENFSAFERDVLTKLFPFYRFQKGITPFVAKELVERPYGLTGQSIRAINRGGEPSEDQFTPEYLRQSAAIPVDASSLFGVKTPGVQRFLTNIDLPHESLLNLFTPGIGNTAAQKVSDALMKTGSNILGQANPLLKGPLESVLNRQFYSGRQLSDLYSMLEHDLGSLNPYLGSWGRMAEQIAVNAPGGSRLLGLMRQVRDERISPSERAAKLLFNTLTGMKFQDVDQDKTLRLAARTTLNQLLDAAPGVSTYENLFIKPEDLARLSETEQRQYLLYRVLQSEAAKRAREKKKQQAALDPLQVLGVVNQF